MAKTRKRRIRAKSRDNIRRSKKRVSILTSEKIEYVDWKDYNLLRKFMSDRAKIRSRRVTGNNAQQQKLVANAIKLAREMALLPYSSRVTTRRQHKEHEGFQGSPDSSPGFLPTASELATGVDHDRLPHTGEDSSTGPASSVLSETAQKPSAADDRVNDRSADGGTGATETSATEETEAL